MIKFYDIRDGWPELPWFSTGGTRAKKFIQSPDDKYYYFKRSQFKPATADKPGKDYRFEFWSEIISYEVGSFLGFDVLRYDIAYDGTTMGCISESMIDAEKEQFIEGVKFLIADNPNYEPENKNHRSLYSFQAIESALEKFIFNRFKNKIVELIVFDAIIGNGDRHQENWAIIMEYEAISAAIEKLKPFAAGEGKGGLDEEAIYDYEAIRFAPFYDNGSSLGRELTDQKVNDLLTSDISTNVYIGKGTAEIHWINRKLSHFDLVRQLLQTNYRDFVINIIERTVGNFDLAAIEFMVERIDIWVPEFVQQFKIPYPRKKLICKLIKFRFQRLKELIDA
ncbi:MAG: hypothetical protein ACJ75B_20810 [Flavisolibacter sp.]